jgi:3-hydroxybutyryl-CoA dehydrogenase
MEHDSYVTGVGRTRFGTLDKEIPELAYEAMIKALQDAQTPIEGIEAIFVANFCAGPFQNQLHKHPVYTIDSPGFIVNRILMTYLNEAMRELHEGVASAEDIDTASKLGLNHPMGPLELADLIGLDIVLNILRTLHEKTKNDKYIPCPAILDTGEGFYSYKKK